MTDAEPGTYALLLKLNNRERITVGKLGAFDFPAGYYLYMGSALGPGGLRARLIEVWSIASEERLECKWGEVARRLSGAQVPVWGFGSSDCRCPAHLIYFRARPDREQFEQALHKLGRG